jgi:hypothetical protein
MKAKVDGNRVPVCLVLSRDVADALDREAMPEGLKRVQVIRRILIRHVQQGAQPVSPAAPAA